MMMFKALFWIVLAFCATAMTAQGQETQKPPDTVVLKNGDRLHGKVLTLSEGKLKFSHSSLLEIEIPMANVADLQTSAVVELLTKDRERLKRQITGIRDGTLLLAAGPTDAPTAPTLALANLDQINPPDQLVRWTGSLAVGAFYTSGNSERRAANASVLAVRETDLDRLTARATWDYAEERTGAVWNLSQRRTMGGLQYDYFLSRRSYLLANTKAEGDTLADIELRWTAGAGFGYQWVDGDRLKFATELGLSYFYENYRSGNPTNDYLAARAAYKLGVKVTDGVEFLQDLTVFPSLERSEDVFLTKDSRLKVGLGNNMFSQLQWILDYNNSPSPGREHTDNRVLLAVGWDF